MNILLLDDNQHRIAFFQNGLKNHRLVVCRHAKAAMKTLSDVQFDIIFLDHDLDDAPNEPDEENSGSEVARFIVGHEIDCECIILHSENRRGRDSMERILGKCQTIPYSKLKKMGFHAILKMAVPKQI